MSIELVACPNCGGCGYVHGNCTCEVCPNCIYGYKIWVNCDACCAQGYVPAEVDEPRCPVCGAESGGDLCDDCAGHGLQTYEPLYPQVASDVSESGSVDDIPF